MTDNRPVLIHEIHDMWPATLVELGGMSKAHPFVRLLQYAENSAYKKSDSVVSILPNTEAYMMEHGLSKGKYNHIPNGIILEDWENPKKLPQEVDRIIASLKSEGKFILGYFGGHAYSNALDVLLDVAKELKGKRNDISIVLVGEGVEKKRLRERVCSENITNVTMIDAIPKKSIPNLIAQFDCVYIGTLDSTLYRFGVGMNKFYDAMMAGKPVVLSTNARNTPIETSKCGIIVPPNDEQGIYDAVIKMAELSEEERRKIGNRGRKEVLDNNTYDRLANMFEEVMGSKPSTKNILYIEHYAGSIDMGMEYRPYYLAQEWIKKGHNVDIIAADFSHLRKRNPQINKDFEKEIIDGIRYHWIHTGRYKDNGVKRALTMFEFVGKLCINAKRIAREISPDVIVTSSTYPLDTYAGQLIRFFVKKSQNLTEIHRR